MTALFTRIPLQQSSQVIEWSSGLAQKGAHIHSACNDNHHCCWVCQTIFNPLSLPSKTAWFSIISIVSSLLECNRQAIVSMQWPSRSQVAQPKENGFRKIWNIKSNLSYMIILEELAQDWFSYNQAHKRKEKYLTLCHILSWWAKSSNEDCLMKASQRIS